MRFSAIAPALAATFAFASPACSEASYCLSDSEAYTVGQNWAHLIGNYSKGFANHALHSTFKDQSDSVATLINNGSTSPLPLGGFTFQSKQAYESAQAGQPDIPFTVLNTWHDCTEVIIRWVSKMKPQQVQGFTAMKTKRNPNSKAKEEFKYQIALTYGEFNSGAWLADLGRPECSSNS